MSALYLMQQQGAAAADSLAALARFALPEGETFATVDGIGAVARELGVVSAEDANAAIIRAFPELKPPFLPGTDVTRYTVGQDGLNLVRFWGGNSGESSYWATFESEAAAANGDMAALRARLALPETNTMEHVSVVRLEPETQIEVGQANSLYGQPGGGLQVRIMNGDLNPIATFKKIR